MLYHLKANKVIEKPIIRVVKERTMELPITGITQLDYDHLHIIKLLDEVGSVDDQNAFIDFLIHAVHYVTDHIAYEEALMEKVDYPGLRLHKIEHQSLVALIRVYLKPDVKLDSIKNKMEVILECKNAFKYHVQQHDLPFTIYLNEHKNG